MSNANSPPTAAAGKNLWQYTASAVGILIVFGFGCLPPIDPITPMGMKVFGIFLGMIFLWSFVSILWPSLLGIVAIALSGYAPMREVLKMSFGDQVSTLVLFAMVLFGAIQHAGVTRYISRWFLTRKIINGRPVMFSFVFIYAAYVLAVLSASVLPVILFMWAILYDVLNEVGYKKGEKYTTIMVVGTLFGTISGQAAKPFTGSALMIIGSFEKAANASLEYLPYMLFGFIMSSLAVIGYALLIKFVLRPDMTKISRISIEHFDREKLPPMDACQKVMTFTLVSFFVLVFLPSIVPKTLPGMSWLIKLGPLGVVIMFLAALACLRINNKPALNFTEMARKYVIWDVYFLVCMAMAISAAMVNKSTGITEFLRTMLDPLLGGHSYLLFAAILVIFGMSITQFANNGVMGVLLMPVVKVFCDQTGGNFEGTATLLIFALHVALLTPSASPYAAVLYGNKDWLSQGDTFKLSLVIILMALLLYVVVGIPVMRMIY
ncbi:MAG: hypothetical protein LBN96_00100 [Desulfovibrio sp.]|jgi:sodium-dependent dicarboxylate transporter 2/3/5|nr:hypothetical protein [Desulfovibrio sp.]